MTFRLLNFLSRQRVFAVWGIVILTLLGLGTIDYGIGSELSISFFYLLPVSLASWSLGAKAGRFIAMTSALIVQGSKLLAGQPFSHPLIIVWNTAIRLGMFLIVANLVSELRSQLQRQTELSRTDSLTGLLNRRALDEALAAEVKRLERHAKALTVALFDLDNFKVVNDSSGHMAGDALLQEAADCLQQQLRGTDVIARLGGDEYVVLLPETDEIAAQKVIPRLQRAWLNLLTTSPWPTTFSIGALTCHQPPPDVQELVHRADQLMYAAKRRGKNCIEYGLYPQSVIVTPPVLERDAGSR